MNTIKMKFGKCVEKLHQLSLSPVSDLTVLKESKTGYVVDPNVPGLIALHPSYPILDALSQEYHSGKIILQDKASCIPASLLNVGPGCTVLDACAAPGNKTTLLAAAVGKTGHVFAIERDSERVVILKNMVEKAGAFGCIFPIFLSI